MRILFLATDAYGGHGSAAAPASACKGNAPGNIEVDRKNLCPAVSTVML